MRNRNTNVALPYHPISLRYHQPVILLDTLSHTLRLQQSGRQLPPITKRHICSIPRKRANGMIRIPDKHDLPTDKLLRQGLRIVRKRLFILRIEHHDALPLGLVHKIVVLSRQPFDPLSGLFEHPVRDLVAHRRLRGRRGRLAAVGEAPARDVGPHWGEEDGRVLLVERHETPVAVDGWRNGRPLGEDGLAAHADYVLELQSIVWPELGAELGRGAVGGNEHVRVRLFAVGEADGDSLGGGRGGDGGAHDAPVDLAAGL